MTSITVIIPTHRDSAALAETLEVIRSYRPNWAIIVVDSSPDSERNNIEDICDRWCAALLFSPVAERSFQLNYGACAAETKWLWFLHADTLPSCEETLIALENALEDPKLVAGGFTRRFAPCGWFLSLTSSWADWRGKKHGLFIGDQAMFVRRDIFNQLGGFASLAKFEDADFSRRLWNLRSGKHITTALVTPGIVTSSRRFTRLGELGTTLRDLWITAKYIIQGEPPTHHTVPDPAPAPTAILMLKTPRPGTVKTRLAATIGDEEAATAYRRMVGHQISQIPRDWKIEIHYAPTDAEQEMSDWLGTYPVDRFVPQSGGDLGDRLTAAGAAARGPLVFLGGDCPWMTNDRLKNTHELLASHDSVINPAHDGGYTMLAMRTFDPKIFENITWSSESVFTETIARTVTLNWKTARLTPLSDVDTIDDWREAEKALG